MDDAWEQWEHAGADLVVTVGQISTNPREHAFSKVAGEVDCCLDVRSQSADVLLDFDRLVRASAAEAAQRTRTQVDFGPQTGSSPALMDAALVRQLQADAADLGIAAKLMASGAGHDTAVFAQQGVRSAMIFVRNENGSHNPDEAMSLDDFGLGACLLAGILARDEPGGGLAEKTV
ncbi:M20/M25/M40 family metallo-hydrolase [Bordetella genomosp. 12]|nr:M20/M25/M40 family metallo-hydrolase [Bordetella genomosp. 12]